MIRPAMKLEVDVQIVCHSSVDGGVPTDEQLQNWAEVAWLAGTKSSKENQHQEVTIRVVSENEMQNLNKQYRSQDKTTNVLSFPFENEFASISNMVDDLLGDIVLCHAVIVEEAKQQKKTLDNHYAHMVTHGILHLCGYDHESEGEALVMEALEVAVLAKHNVNNPYIDVSDALGGSDALGSPTVLD